MWSGSRKILHYSYELWAASPETLVWEVFRWLGRAIEIVWKDYLERFRQFTDKAVIVSVGFLGRLGLGY